MIKTNLQNLTNPLSNFLSLKVCDSFSSKYFGLMGKPKMGEDEGLLFINKKESIMESSIHMFFMRFDIAVIWINKENRVVDKAIAKRWHPYYAPKKPSLCLIETHVHRYKDFQIDDLLEIQSA